MLKLVVHTVTTVFKRLQNISNGNNLWRLISDGHLYTQEVPKLWKYLKRSTGYIWISVSHIFDMIPLSFFIKPLHLSPPPNIFI
jgi:hypothetical protein